MASLGYNIVLTYSRKRVMHNQIIMSSTSIHGLEEANCMTSESTDFISGLCSGS